MSVQRQYLLLLPVPGNYWSMFCPYRVAFSGYCIYIVIWCVYSVSLNLLIIYFGDSLMLYYVPILCSYLLWSRSALEAWTAFCCPQPADGHLDFSSVGLWRVVVLWPFTHNSLCGHMISFFLGKFLGVELLGNLVNLCLTIWGTAKCFAGGCLIFILIRNAWGFWFFLIVPDTWYCLYYWLQPFWWVCGSISLWILICLSLVKSDVDHLFVFLLTITYFIWWNVYSNIWCIYKVLFVHLWLSWESSLYVPNAGPLLVVQSANVFSHSVVSLSIFYES